MEIAAKLKEVEGIVRNSIPRPDETIFTDGIKVRSERVLDMAIYFRNPEDCTRGRGNWVIDIRFKDDNLFCIKLPKEMSKEAVLAYAKPLIDKLEAERKKGCH